MTQSSIIRKSWMLFYTESSTYDMKNFIHRQQRYPLMSLIFDEDGRLMKYMFGKIHMCSMQGNHLSMPILFIKCH
jgi:hypothetical protein